MRAASSSGTAAARPWCCNPVGSTSTRARNGGRRVPVDALYRFGVRSLVLTNAVGGLDPALAPGDLVAAEEIIPWRYTAHRFPDRMRPAFVVPGCTAAGPMPGCHGPCYETPRGIRALQAMGATTVGMSAARNSSAARPSACAWRHFLRHQRLHLPGKPLACAGRRRRGTGLRRTVRNTARLPRPVRFRRRNIRRPLTPSGYATRGRPSHPIIPGGPNLRATRSRPGEVDSHRPPSPLPAGAGSADLGGKPVDPACGVVPGVRRRRLGADRLHELAHVPVAFHGQPGGAAGRRRALPAPSRYTPSRPMTISPMSARG